MTRDCSAPEVGGCDKPHISHSTTRPPTDPRIRGLTRSILDPVPEVHRWPTRDASVPPAPCSSGVSYHAPTRVTNDQADLAGHCRAFAYRLVKARWRTLCRRGRVGP